MNSSPYTPLYSAKQGILARLKEVLNGPIPQQEISTLCISLETIQLANLLPYLDCPQKVLFCEREGNRQYLGAKFLKILSGSFAVEQAQKHITENPKLIILGGQRFHQNSIPSEEWSELGSHYYVLPQFIFVTENNKTELLINIPSNIYGRTTQAIKLLLDLESLLSFKGYGQKDLCLEPFAETPSIEGWGQQVAKAHQAFAADQLKKVVLSRKSIFSSDSSLKPDDLFERLNLRPGEHFIFHLQWRRDRSFTSITPERLFKVEDSLLVSDAIAGTRARGADAVKDEELSQQLKNSQKELMEHRYVSKSVKQTMLELGCPSADIEGSAENIMKLTHVQHLYTKLSGRLTGVKKYSEMINAFHPTPAVGGTPKTEAVDWLKQHESYDRGFYAAPVGVIRSNGADFCVAIRSALIHGKELHVYAGAGIVPASDAQQEWDETAVKMKNFIFKSTQVLNPTEKKGSHEQPTSH